jgi:fibronectin type 3 domain-containing protein
MSEKRKFYDVSGTITGRRGEGLRAARVVVWWQQIRERRELARGETSERGRYHLRYEIPENAPEPVLVIVEALSEYLAAPLLSPLTQAKPSLVINLNLEPPDESDWATLIRAMLPLLDGLKLSELMQDSTHQDISFLAQELNRGTDDIMRVAVAARLETAYKIPAPAFYAFLRQQIPAALPSPLIDASQNFTLIDPLVQNIGSLIFALSAQVQTKAITSAIALDYIGPQFTAQIPQLVNELQALRTTDLLNQPYQVGSATLSQLLETAGLAAAKQQTFAQALATNTLTPRNFWRTLGDGTHGFTAAEASSIERTLSIGAFVKNYVPLIQTVLQGFTAGTYTTLPNLARLSLQAWVQLVNQTGAPPGIDGAGSATPAQVFASVVYTRITRAYPTAALSGRITTGKFIPPAQQTPLVQFFQNNPSLELLKESIPAYLAAQGSNAFNGINPVDQAAVVANVRVLQRILRVAPNTDVAETLLSLGINSATQIAVLGEQQFFLKATAAGMTKPDAVKVYAAGAQRYASLVSLYLQLNNDALGILPGALGQLSGLAGVSQRAVEKDQSLAALFGLQDYCATDDCTSILSPAAYLCDLLLWLRNHQQVGYTVLDVLDGRRPDIRHLLLNCPNTDTELRYVDLVNELLADKISPPVDAISTSFTQEALTDGVSYYYIVTAVNAMGESAASLPVSATPAAATVVPPAPAGLTATAGDNQVTITWSAVAGAVSYNTYWSATPGVTTANGTQIQNAANPMIQTGLTNGTTYYYIVTAVNAIGESAASAQASAVPAVPVAVPPAPAGVTATPGDTEVTITWNAAPGAASYNLYWATSSGVTPTNGAKIPGATSPYLQTTLIDGTTYYYIVAALNAVGESLPSPQVSAMPAPPVTVPGAPAGVTATAGDGQVTISWDPVAGATSYNIYWSTTAGLTTISGTQITGVRNPKWKQTSSDKTEAELAAAPEYFNQGAYLILFGANYPFTLPYSAGLDELRTYLSQWKVPLWQLRQALLPLSGGTLAQQAAVAAERFGIPPHGQDLITNTNFVPRNVAWNTGNQDPANALVPISPPSSNPAQLSFLTAASITYEQLLELLQASWVQGGLNVGIANISDACDTSEESLSPAPLDAGFLDRAHRFLRLWNSTGYKMWELDLLLQSLAVSNGTLDANGLTALFTFRQLQDATKLSVDQQLAFYQDIDTATHRDPDGSTTVSLYDQIFVNPAVTSVAPDPDLEVLPSDGTVADLNLADHLPAVQAALGVSALNMAILIELTTPVTTTLPSGMGAPNISITVASDAGFPAAPFWVSAGSEVLLVTAVSGVGNTTWGVTRGQQGTTAASAAAGAVIGYYPLTLDNLSLLYRVTTLAAAIKYSIPSLIALAELLTPGTATVAAALAPLFASPAATLAFLKQAKAVQQPGLSMDALTYLLTPPLETTLAAAIGAADATLTVMNDIGFPSPNFNIAIGAEILQVTAVAGPGATTWTVTRAQQGTTAAGAGAGASVALVGGWATTTQMTQANIAAALAAVQQAVQSLPTTLTSAIGAADTTLTVASDANFPPPNFYVSIGSEILLVTGASGNNNTTWTVARAQQGTAAAVAANGASVMPVSAATTLAAPMASTDTTITVGSDAGFAPPKFYASIGSEILLVTAVGGVGNTTWTVVRGQQNTTAAAVVAGAAVIPTGPNVNGSAISAMAADAHTSANSGLANDVTSAILQTLQVPGAGQTLLAILSDPAFTGSATPLTPANFPNQFLAVQVFDKAAVMVRGLKLVASDLTWLFSYAAAYGGFDFTALPVTTGQAAVSLSPALNTLLLIKLERLWTAAPPQSPVQTLYDVIAGVQSSSLNTEAAAQAALATITGWSAADITALALALGFTFPASYEQPASYDALRTLEAMAGTAGASGPQIVAWGATPPDEATAETLAAGALGVLKSQQASNDAWLALAPSIMNPIRDRRATALQAYLIGQRDSNNNLVYGDENGLFDYFLIDTQMTSCQVTSRVVQAYIAVQIFVQRCLMNLESPEVVIDPKDSTWNEWEWRSRYRIWEANREVFLYPENWLIESQRPNRTEIYQTFEQEVQQGQSTADYLETVVLNYIDRLDGLAHLVVTGTCEDSTNGDIYVMARTPADPPTFYYRTYSDAAWSGWIQLPLDIKAHQAVPALYRGRLCVFWPVIKVSSEPRQNLPAVQPSSSPANQEVSKYVSISLHFSMYRNGAWAPPQATYGDLFDIPILASSQVSHAKAVEALYTLKVQMAPNPNGSSYAPSIYVDVFRLGDYPPADVLLAAINYNEYEDAMTATDSNGNPAPDNQGAATALSAFLGDLDTAVQDGVARGAIHIGRANFDGRFGDLELTNSAFVLLPYTGGFLLGGAFGNGLLAHAQSAYGPDAQPLLPLTAPDPDLAGEPNLVPMAGALATGPADPSGASNTIQLIFTSLPALDQNSGALLNTAQVPFRVVSQDSDLNFDPGSYFFFQDNRRAYYVESEKLYWTGSFWSPTLPSDPATAAYRVNYIFHPFYHPFTGLFWNQLAGGGFDLLYDPNLQQNPDQIDPSGADVFSFASNYNPTAQVTWDHDDVTGQDRQFLDFGPSGTFSVYHWELFYHIPNYVALLLSQNQQFEDARSWYHYIFNPTLQSSDPAPQRFWIPKPLHNLTTTQILGQQINNLLQAVNQGNSAALQQVSQWQADPFNPFLLADLRLGVPYMKSTVMSYLDNLIAWADNLFSSQSREALSEATLLYVIASEILGPTPVAVTPPQHADESFDQLEPALDAFANALVQIENVIGGAGVSGNGGNGNGNGGIPLPQTFYFKIPPNAQLLGYWTTVGDRLSKMRHCQSITGAPLTLALFDAPIDPGLLIAAQAAGVDLSSVLSNMFAPLPNYRFTALYPVALDFVNAVRAYGASLQAALEKTDAGALSLLQQTTQQQLLIDGNQILDWQLQQAQDAIDATNQTLNLAQKKHDWNADQAKTSNFMNAWEITEVSMAGAAIVINAIAAIVDGTSSVAHALPQAQAGAAGVGGTPQANVSEGGTSAGHSTSKAADVLKAIGAGLEKGGTIAGKIGSYAHRQDAWTEAAAEAQIQIDQANSQLDSANLALQIAQQNQTLHQEQIDNIQKQIDFLNDKFTSDSLYNWMIGSLSATYFQSYQLAYQMCKAVERCYQFELGILNSSFIQFGYWDSLYKGLLAGETLNHDLRRMEASYLQQNARRFEISRYISLGAQNPTALEQLLVSGACDFTLPESLFDYDYPGHYNRRLTRVSVTVVYPSPGKFDNVKATLTMTANQVRVSTDISAGYPENPAGSDQRFVYNYAAVPQKIALGNAQDDPGLFLTTLSNNLSDQRYSPFENAGAISSWHLDMPQTSNEIDLSTVGDVVIHLYYTALDGGGPLAQAATANNVANQPTSGVKVFSAQNDFVAPPASGANPKPVAPWVGFLYPQTTGANQVLTLQIFASKFPAWTRGKTITVTSLTVLVLAWPPGNFVIVPQAPLPTAPITTTPVAGASEPNIVSATLASPGTVPATWSFEIQQQGAGNFTSLNPDTIGDVLLLVSYDAS